MDTYRAVILDSSNDAYETLRVTADTFREALQKVYILMNANDIICDIRKVD